MFPDIAYLDWISGRPEEATYDLGSSDLRRTVPESNDVVPPRLADLPKPPTDTSIEQIVADAYDVGTENVLVTAGATHANFLALAAGLDGDESDTETRADGDDDEERDPRVLVEKPGYEPLVATPEGLGATVDRFRRPVEDDYELDPGRIEGAVTDDTRCIVVTNRHNPSGNRTDRETIAAASRIAAENDVTLLVDEVYGPFCEEGGEREAGGASGASNANGASVFDGPTGAGLSNTVVTNSLTKFLGFGGVRVGWLVADSEFISRARSVMHHVPAISAPSLALARRALANESELAEESRARIAANRELLTEFVAERDDLSGTIPTGCTYGFFAHESATGDEVSQAAWEEDVLVVPGRFFDDSDRFRLSLGLDTETVSESLSVFGSVLDTL
ncbi:pyridoxal phosphate-dependent aminotransferase [Haladaptatus sp. NG-SE-30]